MQQTLTVSLLILSLIYITHCQQPPDCTGTACPPVFYCGTSSTCAGRTITITDPPQNFVILCGAGQTCADSHFIITFNAGSPVTTIRSISCLGKGACDETIFEIINAATQAVTVEIIQCMDDNACRDAVFKGTNVIYPAPSDFVCGPVTASGVCTNCVIQTLSTALNCDDGTAYIEPTVYCNLPTDPTCDFQITPLFKCDSDPTSPPPTCAHTSIIINDPAMAMEILCDGPDSCFGLDLVINIPPGWTAFMIDISCNGFASCKDMNVYIDNNDGALGVKTGTEVIKCMGDNACCGMTVTNSATIANDGTPALTYIRSPCTGLYACYDCQIDDTPCEPLQTIPQ